MCGIFAAWDPINCLRIKKGDLDNLLKHRGPDSQNLSFCKKNQLHLYHSRLKIIDISDDANQPFTSTSNRYEIIFNGEIYNYDELIKEHNITLTTNSDCEVILHLYKKYKISVW